MMCGGPISWASRRQAVVAQSSTEAEYYALNNAVREACWIRSFLEEIDEVIPPIPIYIDNLGASKLAKNPEYHQRTKHIPVAYHSTRDELDAGRIDVQHIPREKNVADGLTKPLGRVEFERFVGLLGMETVEVLT